MTKSEIDALLRRTKAYGCDIRANHDSLMLVGELADALHSQQEEIERAQLFCKDWQNSWVNMEARAKQAEAERDALRADAERYRFLRSPLASEHGIVQGEFWEEMSYKLCREEKMDEQVDGAMHLLRYRIAQEKTK